MNYFVGVVTGTLLLVWNLAYQPKWGWIKQSRDHPKSIVQQVWKYIIAWSITLPRILFVTWYLSKGEEFLLLAMILTCPISQIEFWQCHFLQNVWEQCTEILSGRLNLCWIWDIMNIIRCASLLLVSTSQCWYRVRVCVGVWE